MVVLDEQLAALLLLHLIQDEREGWAGWGRLCFVNRACAAAFKAHGRQVVAYAFGHMGLLLKERDRQLHLWRVNCECGAFFRGSDDSDAGSEEMDFVDGATSPANSVEY